MKQTYGVICCEDVQGTDNELRAAFAADAEHRSGARGGGTVRELELAFGLARSVRSLLAHLSLAERDGSPADVVLIDDYLPGDSPRKPRPSALEAVVAVTARYGDDRPLCILFTASRNPEFVHTFRELGGHHYADKTWDWGPRVEVIWDAIDGGRWKPEPDPAWRNRDVGLTPRQRLLLPYMAADIPADAIARDLATTGRLPQPPSRDRVLEWRSGLAERLGIHLRGQTVALADAARLAGEVWIPLQYQHLLPQGHPDHRAEPFAGPSPQM